MKILVFSDSHSSLWFMRQCVRLLKPDCLIHLGDYAEDGSVIHDENPDILFYQVPGNCDGFYGRYPEDFTKICEIGGVNFLMTHGHRFQVKSGIEKLITYGRSCGVQVILYGHTHVALSREECDGIRVMNPGTAGTMGGSAGLLEISNKEITACRIIGQADLDALI